MYASESSLAKNIEIEIRGYDDNLFSKSINLILLFLRMIKRKTRPRIPWFKIIIRILRFLVVGLAITSALGVLIISIDIYNGMSLEDLFNNNNLLTLFIFCIVSLLASLLILKKRWLDEKE